MDELYDRYVERFKTLTSIRDVTRANQSLWTYDPQAGRSVPPEDDAIGKVYRLRRKATEEIAALDDDFFEEIQVAILDDAQTEVLTRIRADRQRLAHNRDIGVGGYGGHALAEGGVDLATLIADLELSEMHRATIDPILVRYERDANAGFANRFRAQLAMQEASDRWNAVAQRGELDQADSMQRYRDVMEPASERMNEENQALVDLNRAALDKIVDALPAEGGVSVRGTYNRTAFPRVYEDVTSVEKQLTAARQLDNLRPDQRRELDELAASYRPGYAGLSTKMVAVLGQGGMNPAAFEASDWAEYQKRNEQLQRLSYDRSELNFRAINRLKSVLDEDQLALIGGLPRASEEDAPIVLW